MTTVMALLIGSCQQVQIVQQERAQADRTYRRDALNLSSSMDKEIAEFRREHIKTTPEPQRTPEEAQVLADCIMLVLAKEHRTKLGIDYANVLQAHLAAVRAERESLRKRDRLMRTGIAMERLGKHMLTEQPTSEQIIDLCESFTAVTKDIYAGYEKP